MVCSSHHLFIYFSFPSRTAEEVFSYTTTYGRSNIQYILQCLKRFDNVLHTIGRWVKPPSFYSPCQMKSLFYQEAKIRFATVIYVWLKYCWQLLIANLKRVCSLFCGDENLSIESKSIDLKGSALASFLVLSAVHCKGWRMPGPSKTLGLAKF